MQDTSAGTLMTAELALEHGLACATAGGTHHAHPAAGAGFCIVNDLAITAATLLARPQARVARIAILDLDVHQGDGTAACLQGRPDVAAVSVHAARNFPARKVAGTRDVALPDGVGDDEYCSCLPLLSVARASRIPCTPLSTARAPLLSVARASRIPCTPLSALPPQMFGKPLPSNVLRLDHAHLQNISGCRVCWALCQSLPPAKLYRCHGTARACPFSAAQPLSAVRG